MSGIRALQQQLNFGDRAPPMGPRPVNKKPIESPDPSPALAHVTASRAKPQAGRRPPTRRTGITASVASSSVFSTAAADSDDSELEELKRSNEDLLQDNDRLVEQMEEAEQRHSAELERLNEEIRRLRETQSAAKPVAEPPQAAAALPRSFKRQVQAEEIEREKRIRTDLLDAIEELRALASQKIDVRSVVNAGRRGVDDS